MKPLLIFTILFLSICFSVTAQDIKDKSTSVGNSKEFSGAIQSLTKEQTYRYDAPIKLNYWDKAQKLGGFHGSILHSVSNINAKKVKSGEPADFYFELETSGLQYLSTSRPYTFKNGGKVLDFTYTFPCKILVKDKDGNLLKTYIINDGTVAMAQTFHPQLRDDVAFESTTVTNKVNYGFILDDQDLIKIADDEKNSILARMEMNVYEDYLKLASRIITCSYGTPKCDFKPYIISMDKKNIDNFPELYKAITELEATVIEAFSTPYGDDLRKKCEELAKYFESQYNPESSSKNMIKICALDAAVAYLLAGDTEKAYTNYGYAADNLGVLSSAAGTFYSMYSTIALVNQLRTNEDPLIVKPIEDLIDRRQNEGKTH
ncbi:hypothetical protein CLV62_110132 [Dysgonomonas alginatilytica]|uniref:Uncharacterized protein n=1 Tax=Dysgonomonas alginatilytica TaxID=1605892 RepID=A0A2V3PRW1_9BACT|nr:hypothetical protein [Dysgonomonas alginatilytica]PXV64488.1 hypothetical protein CLV62_110132 [Dysgonomonas alginatilytica]